MGINYTTVTASSSGGLWTPLVQGEAGKKKTLTNLLASNLSLGDAVIAVRLVNGVTTTTIVPPVAFPERNPAVRVRIVAIDLTAADQSVEVMAEGSVDWVGSVESLTLL